MPLYLADTSAWNRGGQVEKRWANLVERDELVLCTPVKLELLYSARSRDYDSLARDLDGFLHLELDDRTAVAAARAQQALAAGGLHRGPAVTDLLIAAVAEVHELTLLHYDSHFDAIARVTGQPAEWLARRGSLD